MAKCFPGAWNKNTRTPVERDSHKEIFPTGFLKSCGHGFKLQRQQLRK